MAKKKQVVKIIPSYREDEGIESFHEIEMADGSFIKFPIYSFDLVDTNSCAQYAKLAALEMFEAEYETPCHAWDLRYSHETIPIQNPKRDLPRFNRSGLLTPGDLVGISHPTSMYKNGLDETGERRRYTHVSVFIGEDANRELRFGEQVTDERMTSTLREILERKDIPKEIIKPIDC